VTLRENLHLVNNGHNLNSLGVFLALALHADVNGWAWPSFDTLRAETGITRRETIRAALHWLRDMKIKGTRRVVGQVRLCIWAIWWFGIQK
jgi:hypothetical protein